MKCQSLPRSNDLQIIIRIAIYVRLSVNDVICLSACCLKNWQGSVLAKISRILRKNLTLIAFNIL